MVNKFDDDIEFLIVRYLKEQKENAVKNIADNFENDMEFLFYVAQYKAYYSALEYIDEIVTYKLKQIMRGEND